MTHHQMWGEASLHLQPCLGRLIIRGTSARARPRQLQPEGKFQLSTTLWGESQDPGDMKT